MRILHIIQSLGFGGAENMLIKLVNQDTENEVMILTLVDECPLISKIINKEVLFSTVCDRKSINFLRAIRKANKVVREYKPDIIQAWMYHSELVGLVIKIMNPSVRLFWNIRCSTKYWKNLRLRNKLILRMLILGSRSVSGIFVNSKIELNYITKKGYPKRKVHYIPNGFEDVDISSKMLFKKVLVKKFGLNDNSILIGMVARNDPAKDHDNILKAMRILNETIPNLHLILVGSGFDNDFKEKIKSYNLDTCVHLYGPTSNVFDAVLGFDIGVLSSKTESFPNVVAEYMLAALPVVCSNVSDIEEIIGDKGFIVPPHDSIALAKTIKKIIDMPSNDREELGLAAKQHIIRNYSIEKVGQAYLKKYKESLIPD